MLRPRIIPVLNFKEDGLYKSQAFANYKYVGDPLNAVRIFNEKEVDELAFIDIGATVNNTEPNFTLIKRLARESRMPLSYGGGIRSSEDAIKIISLGVEKVMLSASALFNEPLLQDISNAIGLQSVVVVLDYRISVFRRTPMVYTHNGTINTKRSVLEVVEWLAQTKCVGEIVINSIDNDGLGKGYDKKTIGSITKEWKGPLIALGGCGSYDDIRSLVTEYPMVAAGASSVFTFKGKYRAVLINYLDRKI